jgi:hypothetical protein
MAPQLVQGFGGAEGEIGAAAGPIRTGLKSQRPVIEELLEALPGAGEIAAFLAGDGVEEEPVRRRLFLLKRREDLLGFQRLLLRKQQPPLQLQSGLVAGLKRQQVFQMRLRSGKLAALRVQASEEGEDGRGIRA